MWEKGKLKRLSGEKSFILVVVVCERVFRYCFWTGVYLFVKYLHVTHVTQNPYIHSYKHALNLTSEGLHRGFLEGGGGQVDMHEMSWWKAKTSLQGYKVSIPKKAKNAGSVVICG